MSEATDLCSQPSWLRELDTVGNRRFSGAANAARGRTSQGATALILMGDWCAAAQPTFENQVRGGFDDTKMCNAWRNARRRVKSRQLPKGNAAWSWL
jgi:hypothetical protein